MKVAIAALLVFAILLGGCTKENITPPAETPNSGEVLDELNNNWQGEDDTVNIGNVVPDGTATTDNGNAPPEGTAPNDVQDEINSGWTNEDDSVDIGGMY
jgi:hypothetical protein